MDSHVRLNNLFWEGPNILNKKVLFDSSVSSVLSKPLAPQQVSYNLNVSTLHYLKKTLVLHLTHHNFYYSIPYFNKSSAILSFLPKFSEPPRILLHTLTLLKSNTVLFSRHIFFVKLDHNLILSHISKKYLPDLSERLVFLEVVGFSMQ